MQVALRPKPGKALFWQQLCGIYQSRAAEDGGGHSVGEQVRKCDAIVVLPAVIERDSHLGMASVSAGIFEQILQVNYLIIPPQKLQQRHKRGFAEDKIRAIAKTAFFG